jgi:hypothetical protein
MRRIKTRTVIVLGSFGTIAAIGFAGAMIMVAVGQIVEAFVCAWDSERQD